MRVGDVGPQGSGHAFVLFAPGLGKGRHISLFKFMNYCFTVFLKIQRGLGDQMCRTYNDKLGSLYQFIMGGWRSFEKVECYK